MKTIILAVAADVFFYEDVGTNLFPKGSRGVDGLDIRVVLKDGLGDLSVVELPREIDVGGKMRRTPRYRALRVVRERGNGRGQTPGVTTVVNVK